MYPNSPFLRNPLVESQIIKRNSDYLSDLLKWLCQTPTITTYRVNLQRTTTSVIKKQLETVLSAKYENPPRVFEIAELPEVLCIDKLQLPIPEPNYNDGDDDDAALKEVIVDACCAAAILRGAHIYAPGVLAMETGTKDSEKVRVYVDLAARCKKGTSVRYESSDKLFIGIGVARMQRYQLFTDKQINSGIGVEMLRTISRVPSIGDLSTNEILLQNLPSIICVRVLNPQAHERILDMCCAPGNKTTHIIEMMADTGIVVALDKSARKIQFVQEKMDSNHFNSVKVFAFDATKSFTPDSAVLNDDDDDPRLKKFAPPYAANTFDRILLDAPCSALGNRPLLSSNMTPKMLQSFPRVQRRLFEAAVQLLKPKGVLVYSTCTVAEDENEQIVTWALEKFTQLRLVDAIPRFGGPGLGNLGLNEEQRLLVQRFGPSTTNANKDIDTIGFFIAKFVKIKEVIV